MPLPEPLRETVVRVDAPAHHFSLLVTPEGDFLGLDDAGDPVVLDEADDREVWEKVSGGYRHDAVYNPLAHVDTWLEARLHFPSGIVATVSGDMRAGVSRRMDLTVMGERGTLHVVNPLAPQIGHSIRLDVDGEAHIETRDRRSSYAYQLDAFLDAVEEGKPLLTGPEDAVHQMRAIDRCYGAAGLPIRGLDLS